VVPLVAFNASAIVSGAAAGRLKDSARKARIAEAKNAFLLRVSDGLQKALRLPDVARIADSFLPVQGLFGLEIYVTRDGTLYSPREEGEVAVDGVSALMPPDGDISGAMSFKVYPLQGTDSERGLVKFLFNERSRTKGELPDLQAIANLLALAVDRCLLLERLAEGRAVQRSEELKSAILSSVSHDLRTPLTAIEAAASSLRSYDETLSRPQKQKMLLTIEAQCEQLNRYTGNLLDMGRIQAGISNAGFEQVDLIEILGAVIGSIRRKHPDQLINKDYTAAAAIVFANAVMLEQAIFNVMENAILHGDVAEPLQVRLYTDPGEAVLEVTDYGPGIRPSDQPHVFERFYKASQTSDRGGGSGLGLYIANGFVKAFDGSMELFSPVLGGRGTTMFIRLPLVEMNAHPEPAK
jgi:two-component system sensor histidine kinase KdpD